MNEIDESGFYPLTQRHLDAYVPATPGTFSLSVKLASGAHYIFHAGETADLHDTLRRIIEGEIAELPYAIREVLGRYQCYLSTFAVAAPDQGAEIEKMLLQTSDPISRLRVTRIS